MLDLEMLLQVAGVLTGKQIHEGWGGVKWIMSMQENLVQKYMSLGVRGCENKIILK